MRRIYLAAAATLVIGGCATPQPAPDPERTPEQQEADRQFALKNGYRVATRGGHTVYCKTWPVTTSRIQTRDVCLTAQELDAQERNNRHAMEAPNPAGSASLPSR